eukprot:gb/GFBE01023500.1/.p1 GENE.gb/GFBE01023500.1/~~gb/GFBE01023500.1/.p1  ORF type:complete len:486 (+),score=90.32 gb/GFBE01023500.1/:1-1458(+)
MSISGKTGEHIDVVVVGAGISGIGAGYWLQKLCPQKSFVILEGRENLGGTWDFFRYPGLRSDSDMHTFGYSFHPWRSAQPIAEAAQILDYLREVVRTYRLEPRIRFNHEVQEATFSSSNAKWTLMTSQGVLTCSFLFLCSGYYKYDKGFTPDFEGIDHFKGQIAHPQQWGPDINYDEKRVAIIGSGATAITLAPNLAKTARHVTLVQRSPSYIYSMQQGSLKDRLLQQLPLGKQLIRWNRILYHIWVWQISKRYPEATKQKLIETAQSELPDVDPVHLTPKYDPWDQRICACPDGDFFEAVRRGDVTIVTDGIERFEERGLRLQSGKLVEADLIVTATGMNMQSNLPMSTIRVTIDGKPYVAADHLIYRGLMLDNVPNLFFTMGYFNASWTLRSDLTCQYVARLLNYMDQRHYNSCVPRAGRDVQPRPEPTLSSGYLLRSWDKMPKESTKSPWMSATNFLSDKLELGWSAMDESMEFGRLRLSKL